MVASLETLDNIRDRLMDNGLGTSALGVQALQRQNLPDLKLATANATRQNASSQRMSEVISKISKDALNGVGRGGGVGGGGATAGALTKPFVLGMNKGLGGTKSQYAVAIKGDNGNFAISSMDDNTPLVDEAKKNKVFSMIPEINEIFASTLKSSQYNSNQLVELLGSKKTNLQGNNLQDIINRLL